MALIGNILLILLLALVLILAIMAIIRGFKGIKTSKRFEIADKKVKVGYGLVSAIHMAAGILIALCYGIAGILILLQY